MFDKLAIDIVHPKRDTFFLLHGVCDGGVGRGYHACLLGSSKSFKMYGKNSLPPSGEFCSLLITFANSLDPDQESQNVGPGLNPSRLTPEIIF